MFVGVLVTPLVPILAYMNRCYFFDPWTHKIKALLHICSVIALRKRNGNVCVSGGKKCLFFGKFGVLCFLETPVLRFANLPHNRRLGFKMEMLWFLVKCLDPLCIVVMPRRHNGVLRNKVKTPIYNSYFIWLCRIIIKITDSDTLKCALIY